MSKNDYKLYWEDVDERLIYAELDDQAWRSPEQLLGYSKADSFYIYHDGKLAAFYSIRDTEEEARLGYAFYSKEENVLRVIKMKETAKKEVDSFIALQQDLNAKGMSDGQLHTLMVDTIDYCQKALRAHFLTQAQFFEHFEAEGDLKHVTRLEDLSKARFEYSRKAWSAILGFSHKLFEEYGRRHGLTLAEAESMTREELIAQEIDKDLYRKRSKKFVLTSDYHKQNILLDKKVDEYINKYEQYENIDSVRGVVGNSGVVQAPAFVLKNEYLDLKKLPSGMKKGMVLIVQNAWPELTQYYHAASAIVTNEGGITSHGVVVARELGIPCIVGTRIATKIFNTGDMVEVDADKGVVRILEKTSVKEKE